ncbi:MAG: pseudouridine synthase [Alphaproteobacteria bacterium]
MSENKHKGERIAKVMARAGLCSRRDAEKWIAQGRVSVNGKAIDSPALNVMQRDVVLVDGKTLPDKPQTRLFLYHKPPGLVTTHKDEKGRATVFDQLPAFMPRVVSVGRLDLNTEGLLLLTNDGGLARFLELPSTGWARKYRVRVHGKINEKRLKSLENGITIDGVRYGPVHVEVEAPFGEGGAVAKGTNSWLSMRIREGKNREIRRIMEGIGLNVTRLIRTDYGPFSLGKIKREAVVEVKTDVMKHQIAKYFSAKEDCVKEK